MTDALAWAGALAVLGAVAGSFFATIVIRWPQDRSILHGRSCCDACGTTIGARDLVPVFSALALRGRCRACGARIDSRHWRIEGLAALIGAATGLAAASPEAIGGAVFGWLLLTIAALDLDELWIPDRLTATLAATGLVAGAVFPPDAIDRLIGGVGGFAALWLVSFAYRWLRGRDGMGAADPKLFGAIGLWLGWRMLPAVLMLAALVGLGVALFQAARGGEVTRTTAFPFGTFLAIAAYAGWLAMISYGP